MLDFCISNGLRITGPKLLGYFAKSTQYGSVEQPPSSQHRRAFGSELMRWLYSPFTLLQPPQGAGPLPGDLPFGRAEAASRQHYWADSHQLTSLNEYAGCIW